MVFHTRSINVLHGGLKFFHVEAQISKKKKNFALSTYNIQVQIH
jgi:hypothetical protein